MLATFSARSHWLFGLVLAATAPFGVGGCGSQSAEPSQAAEQPPRDPHALVAAGCRSGARSMSAARVLRRSAYDVEDLGSINEW
jgi:hypothetical protein